MNLVETLFARSVPHTASNRLVPQGLVPARQLGALVTAQQPVQQVSTGPVDIGQPSTTSSPTATTPSGSTTTDDFRPPPIPDHKKQPNVEREVDPRTNRVKVFLKNTVNHCAKADVCKNGGKCRNLPDEDTFACDCLPLWTGKECERVSCLDLMPQPVSVTNACTVDLCANGGVCRNIDGRAVCECAGEWAGARCQSPCPQSRCGANGKCVVHDEANAVQACRCSPGYTGDACELEVNECQPNPCLHGGQCTDKLNAFECACAPGFMGRTCHRPCQDIYRSCPRWQKEDRCEAMRQQTNFFDVNCAVTCQACAYRNETGVIAR